MPKQRQAKDTVEHCFLCGCKTWHVDGICEWSDMHQDVSEVRVLSVFLMVPLPPGRVPG
jgi:hypothetical protein